MRNKQNNFECLIIERGYGPVHDEERISVAATTTRKWILSIFVIRIEL